MDRSYRVVILFGVLSFLGDVIYEGSRSILGQYLYILGASSLAIGIIFGLGELINFILRSIAGYLADRTNSYWLMLGVGYGLLICIFLITFVNVWYFAGLLFLFERLGKAIRTPARDVLLAQVSKGIGLGKTFGIHKFIDQFGAILGPIIVSYIILVGSYKQAFFFMIIPYLLVLLVIFLIKRLYHYGIGFHMEKGGDVVFKKGVVYFLLSIFFAGMGCVSFGIMGFHWKASSVFSDAIIPIIYSFGMLISGFFSLLLGVLFDRLGIKIILIGILVSIFYPFLTFSNSWFLIIFGVFLWAIGLGVNESTFKLGLARLYGVSGQTFGIFYSLYGLGVFLGGVFMGYFYQFSIYFVVIFSVLCQFISFCIFWALYRFSSRSTL